jgi:hypothetical protein
VPSSRGASAALLLTGTAGPSEAATGSHPGLWTGFWDGFVSLLRFLISPLLDVSVFDHNGAGSGLYVIGYFTGVLGFALAAASAASAERNASVVVARGNTLPQPAPSVVTGL